MSEEPRSAVPVRGQAVVTGSVTERSSALQELRNGHAGRGAHRAWLSEPVRPTLTIIATAVAFAASCASGRMPSPGSATEHDAAARGNMALADAHERAASEMRPCADLENVFDICWTHWDTTQEHHYAEQRHRRLAAAHAAQAAALRRAESEACAGIADSDRGISPFLRLTDIARADLLDPADARDELTIPVLRVVYGRVPGLDAANLERLIDCHLARNAALGHEVPEMDDCPLVPPGVDAKVTQRGGEVSVTITTDEPHFAEVFARAQRLVERTRGAR